MVIIINVCFGFFNGCTNFWPPLNVPLGIAWLISKWWFSFVRESLLRHFIVFGNRFRRINAVYSNLVARDPQMECTDKLWILFLHTNIPRLKCASLFQLVVSAVEPIWSYWARSMWKLMLIYRYDVSDFGDNSTTSLQHREMMFECERERYEFHQLH